MRRFFLIAVLFLLYAVPAHARLDRPQDFVCPLDGRAFAAAQPVSGTSFGIWLDLQPFGPIAAPWPLPECPEDGFLLYKKEFSAEELAVFRAYTASGEYRALRETPGQYWRFSHLLEREGVPLEKRAFILLQSTWEADAEHYPARAEKTLEAFGAVLRTGNMETEKILTARMVSGELERRLGRFADADARFEALKKDEACRASEVCCEAVARERSLIREGDSSKQLLRPTR